MREEIEFKYKTEWVRGTLIEFLPVLGEVQAVVLYGRKYVTVGLDSIRTPQDPSKEYCGTCGKECEVIMGGYTKSINCRECKKFGVIWKIK